MASQSAATTSKDTSSSIPVNSARDKVHDRVRDRIASRAYDLYQQNGNQDGQDMRHWLQAESEILNQVPEIRESGSWYTVNIPLRGFAAGEVQISVEPRVAIVAAEKQQVTPSAPERGSDVLQQTIFTRAEWPEEVDPGTASAYLKNGVMTLTVKRASPGTAGAESDKSLSEQTT
jgi:HSP20 family molecular chaperone IbpA